MPSKAHPADAATTTAPAERNDELEPTGGDDKLADEAGEGLVPQDAVEAELDPDEMDEEELDEDEIEGGEGYGTSRLLFVFAVLRARASRAGTGARSCPRRHSRICRARAESSSSASTTTSTLTWISWFCALPGHEYFCEVAEVRTPRTLRAPSLLRSRPSPLRVAGLY